MTPPSTPSRYSNTDQSFQSSYRASPISFTDSPEHVGGNVGNSDILQSSHNRFPSTDLSNSQASKSDLRNNLSKVQSTALAVMTGLESSLQSADPVSVGDKILTAVKTASRLLDDFVSHIQSTPDAIDDMVSKILSNGQESSAEEQDALQANLSALIASSPPILTDISASLSSITASEAVEIADVGAGISCVTIAVARHALQKVDVDRVVDAVMEGPGLGGVQLLDDEGNEIQSPGRGSPEERGEVEAPDLSNAPRVPIVFWPPLTRAILDQSSPDSPLRSFVSGNKALSFLLSLMLLSPPSLLLGAILLPPVLVTDTIAQSAYSSLKSAYPNSIANVEISTAQVIEVIKLYVLLAKIFTKTSLRITKRQIERRGGLANIAKDAAFKAMDAAAHPIRTAGKIRGVAGAVARAVSRTVQTITSVDDAEW